MIFTGNPILQVIECVWKTLETCVRRAVPSTINKTPFKGKPYERMFFSSLVRSSRDISFVMNLYIYTNILYIPVTTTFLSGKSITASNFALVLNSIIQSVTPGNYRV